MENAISLWPAILLMVLAQAAGQTAEEKKGDKPPAFEKIEAALDRAIGMHRMAVATAGKLIIWYEVDRDSKDAQDLQAEFCGNMPAVKQANEDLTKLMEKTTPERIVLEIGTDRADGFTLKMKQLAKLERDDASQTRQLTAMGMTCPDASRPAEKLPTMEDLDIAVDKAMDIIKAAVANEDKLMTLNKGNRGSREAHDLQSELCRSVDAVNQAAQDVQHISKYIFSEDFQPMLRTYPDGTAARLDDRLKGMAKMENVFVDKGWQLKSMGWSCASVATKAEKTESK